ncbi:YqiA/YcfP family alpha/beta fold hydrolase [Marinobacter sp. X15-166B]|uniref:YqiA/YcfP family alpha/beta fold hydrolase n=1 Tax=Marinobacter sp. X15-166B TaxID=1897620 RepID=UPI000944C5F1|nr:YqiA/YcfP family alpha/beta fold hydrolase [Marinobacter sp. X15-166B]
MNSSRPGLVYLHGFNSSPKSQKVSELRALLPRLCPEIELLVPELGFDPARAYQRARRALASLQGRPAGVIGSSLGGYYAAALSEETGVNAALINPAVYPYRLLQDYLGPQHNPYTDERYELTRDHMAALLALDPGKLRYPERLLVLLQSGDETLDYREALARFPDSPTWLQAGGDHRFQQFDRVVPAILAFLYARPNTPPPG